MACCKLAASGLFTNKVWNGGDTDQFDVLSGISLDRLNKTANSLWGFCDSDAGCFQLESDSKVITRANPLHCTSVSQHNSVPRNRCKRFRYCSDTVAVRWTFLA